MAPRQGWSARPMTDKIVEGVLEITDKGFGFLRNPSNYYKHKMMDPYVGRDIIHRLSLREGLTVKAASNPQRGRNPQVVEVLSLNDRSLDEYLDVVDFEEIIAVDPSDQIVLETGAEPLGTRVVDLLMPVGKGQRGLLVAPPRTGKTILLQQIANGIVTNHPEIRLIILLIDERP